MKTMVKMPIRAGIICLLLTVGGAVLGGCGSGGGNPTGDTTRLVGFWSLVKTSGGLSGNGYPVTLGMELLTFNTNGTFTRTVSGQATTGTYQVTERSSLLSAEKLSVITYRPSGGGDPLPDVVTQVDSQHLVVSEEAADGYSREYQRVVQTN